MVNSEELARQYWVYQTEDEEKHKKTTLSNDEPNIVFMRKA
jgi:hypothetical protein